MEIEFAAECWAYLGRERERDTPSMLERWRGTLASREEARDMVCSYPNSYLGTDCSTTFSGAAAGEGEQTTRGSELGQGRWRGQERGSQNEQLSIKYLELVGKVVRGR